MDSGRKRSLLLLAGVSIAVDLFMKAGEFSIFPALPFALGPEELVELLISTLISGDRLKLDWLDRTLGLLPIPGVTAVTVRVIREIRKG